MVTRSFADPKLVSTTAPLNLHLRLDSPAIDAGDPAFAPSATETDLDGGSRSTGTRVDLGADELASMDAWRRAQFGSQATNMALTAANATPADDGIPNFLKYALGLSPLQNSTGGLPQGQVQSLGGSRYITLRFTRLRAATDVTYTVQASENLQTGWNQGSRYSASGESPTNAFTTEVGRSTSGDLETITVRTNSPINETDAQFLRLHVSHPTAP